MKILWVSNYPLPDISNYLGLTQNYNEGWKIVLSYQLLECNNVNVLAVAFPSETTVEIYKKTVNNICYYMFPSNADISKYNENAEEYFTHIYNDFDPDIIHVWGTEFPHALAAVEAAEKANILKRIIVSIQGVMGEIAKSYTKCLPFWVVHRRCIGDLLIRRGIQKDKHEFEKRAVFETHLLLKCRHIIGRTDFDRAYASNINHNLTYHHCNETLRNEFYKDSWRYDQCNKYTLFMSQASYPVKGLHILIRVMAILKDIYPYISLRISGGDIISKRQGKLAFLKRYSYSEYLRKLIFQNNLENNIKMLGPLNAAQMKREYLNCNAFISSSMMENSPNSVGEAMLLGVPVVASNVGGSNSMITHSEEGFLYQYDLPYMCAFYISQIFDSKDLSISLGRKARVKALKTHNMDANLETLMNIYTTFTSR